MAMVDTVYCLPI